MGVFSEMCYNTYVYFSDGVLVVLRGVFRIGGPCWFLDLEGGYTGLSGWGLADQEFEVLARGVMLLP